MGALFLVWLAGVLGGGTLGLLTNSVNAWVSPLYFINVLRWDRVADVSRAAMAQGAFEGLIMGLGVATIFVGAMGLISRVRCPFATGIRFLVGLLASALGAWVLGGLLAMGLAGLSPEFYRSSFKGVPSALPEMVRYAWVGGSIWGIQFGSVALLILWIVIFKARWHQPQ